MPKAKTSRKQLFRAALAIAGQTASEWASAQGLTPQHLSNVLNGHRESARLVGKMDDFIRQQLGKQQVALAS